MFEIRASVERTGVERARDTKFAVSTGRPRGYITQSGASHSELFSSPHVLFRCSLPQRTILPGLSPACGVYAVISPLTRPTTSLPSMSLSRPPMPPHIRPQVPPFPLQRRVPSPPLPPRRPWDQESPPPASAVLEAQGNQPTRPRLLKILLTLSSKPRSKTRTPILTTPPGNTRRSQKKISHPTKIPEQKKEKTEMKTRTQSTIKSGVCQIRSLKSGTASVRESTPKKRTTSLTRIVTSILALSLSWTPTSTGLWPLALPAQNKKPKCYTSLPLLAHSASTRLTNSWRHTQNYKAQSDVISKKVGCISRDFTNTPWPGSISSRDYKETLKPKHLPRSNKRVSGHSSAEVLSPQRLTAYTSQPRHGLKSLPLNSANQNAATPVEVLLPRPAQVLPNQI
jgi:hypothetical protein